MKLRLIHISFLPLLFLFSFSSKGIEKTEGTIQPCLISLSEYSQTSQNPHTIISNSISDPFSGNCPLNNESKEEGQDEKDESEQEKENQRSIRDIFAHTSFVFIFNSKRCLFNIRLSTFVIFIQQSSYLYLMDCSFRL